MLQQGLAYFHNAPLSVVGFMIFFVAFIVLTLWTFWGPRKKGFYDDLAQQPLREEGELS